MLGRMFGSGGSSGRALVLAAFVLSNGCASTTPAPQASANADDAARAADAARLVVDDIVRFESVLPRALAAPDSATRVRIIEEEYLQHGTPGLQDFRRGGRIVGPEAIARNITAYPRYYASLATLDEEIAAEAPRLRAGFRRLKEMYPPTYFPDVYFIIGHLRSCGSVSERGLLIGADCYGVRGDAPTDEFSPVTRNYVHPFADMPQLVMHELVHFQQQREGKTTLLEATLIEGGAEFLSNLVMPWSTEPANHAWGVANRARIWDRFAREMHGTDTSAWIANNDRETPDWPAALSYFVGYEIAKAYYERSADKRQAVRDLMELVDAEEILARSGYAELFSGR